MWTQPSQPRLEPRVVRPEGKASVGADEKAQETTQKNKRQATMASEDGQGQTRNGNGRQQRPAEMANKEGQQDTRRPTKKARKKASPRRNNTATEREAGKNKGTGQKLEGQAKT